MKLADWMSRENIDDEAMAARIRADGIRCERTMVLRYRLGRRRPEWPMINRIAEITSGEVSGDDWMTVEAAE